MFFFCFVFLIEGEKKALQRHKQTKKLIWVEHPFKDREEGRCITEQYAQHKVQEVRLCTLIESRVGEEQWQKTKKTYAERGNHSI